MNPSQHSYLPKFFVYGLFLTLSTGWLHAQVSPRISLSSFASGFSSPVDISHAGDDRLFVTERGGRIRILFPDGTIQNTPFLDIDSRVRSGGERGLLGLAFSPQYSINGEFYVNYTNNNGDTHISRFHRDSTNINGADPNSEEILLEISQPYTNHNGGDLAFGPDGFLYIALGDGGSGGDPDDQGQTPNTYLGKILRIDVESDSLYAIPANNPFVNNASVLDEIWSLGWRNPWRFSFDRGTGDMWIADVGQNALEEISFEPAGGQAGGNYGWRCYEGTQAFNLGNCGGVTSTIDPVFEYPHVPNVGGSITGGFVYRGQNFPNLQGHYIYAEYVHGFFGTVYHNGTEWDTTYQEVLLGQNEASTFGEDLNGELYVASIKTGTIYQITDLTTDILPSLLPQITLGPNPMQDHSTLKLPEWGNNAYEVQIMDIQGRVLREYLTLRAGELQIDRGGLLPGIYAIRVQQDQQTLTTIRLSVK